MSPAPPSPPPKKNPHCPHRPVGLGPGPLAPAFFPPLGATGGEKFPKSGRFGRKTTGFLPATGVQAGRRRRALFEPKKGTKRHQGCLKPPPPKSFLPPLPDYAHAVRFLGVPLPSPLPGGFPMSGQTFLIDLFPFFFPTDVFGSFPSRHGKRHVQLPPSFGTGTSSLRPATAQALSPPRLKPHRKGAKNHPKTPKKKRGGVRTGPCQVFSRSIPALTLSKSAPPQFRTCRRLPSLRSTSWKGPLRRGSSKKFRTGFFSWSPSCASGAGGEETRDIVIPWGDSHDRPTLPVPLRPPLHPLVPLVFRDFFHLLVHLLDVPPPSLFPLLPKRTPPPKKTNPVNPLFPTALWGGGNPLTPPKKNSRHPKNCLPPPPQKRTPHSIQKTSLDTPPQKAQPARRKPPWTPPQKST